MAKPPANPKPAPTAKPAPGAKPAAAEVVIHPIIEAAAHLLTPTGEDSTKNLAFKDDAIKKLEEMFTAIFDKQVDFNAAIQCAQQFADYLEKERESPGAAQALRRLLPLMIENQNKAAITNEAKRREQVGQDFKKFLDKKPAREDEIPSKGPTIAAKDLIRKYVK